MFRDESSGFWKRGEEGRARHLIHRFPCVRACSAHSPPSLPPTPSLLYFWKHLILVSQARHAHGALLLPPHRPPSPRRGRWRVSFLYVQRPTDGLLFKPRRLHAPFAGRNQRHDAATFLASVSIRSVADDGTVDHLGVD